MEPARRLAQSDLVLDGYNPAATADAIYFNDLERGALVRVDETLYDRIQAGQIRL